MMEADVQRTLGRIEATLESHADALQAIREWQVLHEFNHHGRHGRGPGGLVTKANAQATGIFGTILLLIEAVWQLVG